MLLWCAGTLWTVTLTCLNELVRNGLSLNELSPNELSLSDVGTEHLYMGPHPENNYNTEVEVLMSSYTLSPSLTAESALSN